METTTTIRSLHARGALRARFVFWAVPSSLLIASVGRTAIAAQPAVPTPAASAPAAPAPSAVPAPAPPVTGAPASAAPAPNAAQPLPAEPSAPVATPVPSAAASGNTAIPADATTQQPVTRAKHDEYDGPPLLLGDKKKKLTLGGYGGPTIAYTHMLRRDGVLIGGEGAVLIDHRLSFGGAGYVFSRTPDGPAAADGTAREFFTGYGGFLIRYAVYSQIPVYASFGTLIGGGALTLAPRHQDDDDTSDDHVQTRGFFVLQPDVSLHVNATRWLRFGLTFGYRIATAVDHFAYQSNEMSGPIVGGNFQGGWF